MLLRYLITQYVQQAAGQKLQDAVMQAGRSALEGQAGDEDASPIRPELLFFFGSATESGGLVDKLTEKQSVSAAGFTQHLGLLEGRPVGVIESGVGLEATTAAVAAALQVHRPTWMVAAGFAAALTAKVGRGQILMADRLVAADGSETLDVGLRISEESAASVRGLEVGSLTSVDHLLTAREQKQKLAESSGAIACDMESLAVARACQQHHTRFLAVRIITDGLEDRPPPEVAKLLQQQTLAGKLGAAAGAIFNRPGSVKDMWELKEQALRATDRLAKFLISMLPQLPA